MRSVLEELFSGQLSPREFPPKESPESLEVDRKLDEKIEEIESRLGEDGHKLVDSLLSIHTHSLSFGDRRQEKDIFCLGAMLMIEIMGYSIGLLGEE